MSFARPEAFLLVIPLTLILVMLGRRDASRFSLFLRALAVFLVAGALTRPVWQEATPPPLRILAIDRSSSADDPAALARHLATLKAAMQEDEELRVFAYGERVHLFPASLRLEEVAAALETIDVGEGSQLELALETIATLGGGRQGARAALLTDGRCDRGFPERAAEHLRGRDLRCDVLAMGRRAEHPIVNEVRAPSTVARDATIEVDVALATLGGSGASGVVELFGDGVQVSEPFDNDGGFATITLRCEAPREGELDLQVQLRDAAGQVVPGSLRRVPVTVRAPLPVLLVEADDAPSVASGLGTALGAGVHVQAVRASALDVPTLQAASLVVLSDLPASALTTEVHAALPQTVAAGQGLLVAGGRRAFGTGGWAGTSLETLLPVSFVQKEERRDPSASLVVIIDTSGSMGGGRIDIAKEVARLALKRLKPHDKAGIVEFHGAKRWAAPLQSAANAVDLQRALNRLNAGGGTVILPAIEEAYYGLLNAQTRTRHVLVLTDGGVEQGAFEPLIRRMAEEGMTLSTVLVGGSGAYSSFLVSLAQWGRGRFYHAPDRFNLPEVIVKQPESSLLSPWVEREQGLELRDDGTPLSGLVLEGGVAGLTETELKTGARLRLVAEDGRPLLASWHHGLGEVVAWTSELAGPWTGALARDPEYPRVLAGLVDEAIAATAFGGIELEARAHARSALAVRARARDLARSGPLSLELDGPAIGTPLAGLLLPSDGGWTPERLFEDVAPDQLVAITARDPQSGEALARVRAALPPRTEWTEVAGNAEGLGRLLQAGGGEYGRVLDVSGEAAPAPRELWPLCVAAGALLFLLGLFWRRRTQIILTALLGLGVAVLPLPAQTPTRAVRISSGAVRVTPTPGGATATLTLRPASAEQEAPSDGVADLEEEVPELDEEMRKLLATALTAPLENQVETEALFDALRRRDGDLRALTHHLDERLSAAPLGKEEGSALHLFASRVWMEEGEPEAAKRLLIGVGEDLAQGVAYHVHRARLLEFLGEDRDAVASLDEALALVGDDVPSQLALGVRRAGLLFTQIGGREEGVAAIAALLEQHGSDPRLRWYLAFIAALNGHSDFLLACTPTTDDEKERFFQTLVLGSFRLRAGQAAAAVKDFEEAFSLADLDRDKRFAQERLVAAHRAAGTLDGLIDVWLKETERSALRLDALVAVLRERRRTEQALDLLLQEGADRPTDPDLQREIIALALESGRESDVLGIYERLIDTEPDRLSWRSGLALLHLLRGRRAEAEEAFRGGLAAAGTGVRKLQVARAASEMGLRPFARSAAETVVDAEDPKASALARLFLAELDFEAGDTEGSLESLKTVEGLVQDDAELLARVADLHERQRRPGEAMRVLERVQKISGAEDIAMRLAWMLEERGEHGAALDRWFELWQKSNIPARQRQAEDRMLDLGARQAKLADIAIDLEKGLQAGGGSSRDLGFLVRIYARANDPVAAVEVLREFGGRFGKDRVSLLNEMARVYQQCDDYRRYEDTLDELRGLDPENALDYQQQLALGALERGRGRTAKRVLEQLLKMSGHTMEAQEFAAGVLAMVQLEAESARAYGRVLANHPDRIETHLLRANVLRDMGRSDAAVRAFLLLLERADKDDLFTIAVDGVLNLEGGAAPLRVAWRRIVERLAVTPRKVFLWQLGADIADERGDADLQRVMTEMMALAGGERRPAILRELMDLATIQSRPEDLLRHGRSLLALGQVMPPQVFLDLGEALVRTGDLETAERVFGRARTSGDFVAIQKRIAGAWSEAGYYASAERTLREALLARPDDVELLQLAAEAAETIGATERAARDWEHGMTLLLRRSPSLTSAPGDERGGRRVIRTANGVRIIHIGGFGRSRNVDDFQRLEGTFLQGLLATATPETFHRLVTWIDEERNLLVEAELVGKKPSENLRLERLHRVARSLGFALRLHDDVDGLDRTIMGLWPEDKDWRAQAVEERLERGLLARARALAVEFGFDPNARFEALRRDERLRQDDAALRRLVAQMGQVPPEEALELLPGLYAQGRRELCREVLERVVVSDRKVNATIARRLADFAHELDEPALCGRYYLRALELVAREGFPRGLADQLSTLVKEVRNTLGEGIDPALDLALKGLTARVPADRKDRVSEALLRIHAETGLGPAPSETEELAPLELWTKRLQEVGTSPYGLLPELSRAPSELQEQLADQFFPKLSKPNRLALASIVGHSCERDFVEPVQRRVVEMFRENRDRNRSPSMSYMARRLGEAVVNREPCRRMLDILSGENPEDLELRVQVARVSLKGAIHERDRAIAGLVAVVEEVLVKAEIPDEQRRLVDQLLFDADAGVARAVQNAVRAAGERGFPTPGLVALVARLDVREQRFEAALERLQQALELHPEADELELALQRVLTTLGRTAEVAERRAAWLDARAGSDDAWRYNALAMDYWNLSRPAEALEALGKARQRVQLNLELAVHLHLGDEEAARSTFRRMMGGRNGFFGRQSLPAPPRAGGLEPRTTEDGLQEFLGDVGDFQSSLIGRIARYPFGPTELRPVLRRRQGVGYLENDPIAFALAWERFKATPEEASVARLEAALAADAEPQVLDLLELLLVASRVEDPSAERLLPALERLEHRFLSFEGGNPQLLTQVARIHIARGRNERARPLLEALIDRVFDGGGGMMSRGNMVVFSSVAPGMILDANETAETGTPFALWLETFPPEERRALAAARVMEQAPTPEAPITHRVSHWRSLASLDLGPLVVAAQADLDAHFRALLAAGELPGRAHLSFLSGLAVDGAYDLLEEHLWLRDPEDSLSVVALLNGVPKDAAVAPLVDVLLEWLDHLPEERAAGQRFSLMVALARRGEVELVGALLPEIDPRWHREANERLSLADAHRMVGQEAAAERIERQLLAERALPGPRIAPLLERLLATEGEETVRHLAETALKDHLPADLLRLALRLTKDPARRGELEALLRLHHGG